LGREGKGGKGLRKKSRQVGKKESCGLWILGGRKKRAFLPPTPVSKRGGFYDGNERGRTEEKSTPPRLLRVPPYPKRTKTLAKKKGGCHI